ncbi:MAG: YybH family protein [Yoonia sp.]|uniref:YybH family protein n=1 Tax=Yoonia sp. TaxID=2212373 RepID=UPI003EF9694B
MDHKAFAATWEEAWNSHDLDRIMAHYSDGIVFRSKKAAALVGNGKVKGKPALRAYWEAALARQPDLRFRVQSVFEGHQMMVMTYLNHRDVLAAETLYFDATGEVYQAAACHCQGSDRP